MKFIIADNYDNMSKISSQLIIDQIIKNPKSILGLATGSTPVGMYKYLVDAYNQGLDFSSIITFNLDEYYGIPSSHPQSYRYFMDHNLFNHINIAKSNIHIPNGLCENVDVECFKYDDLIENTGGIDLQVLGIGRNGHIGFNEPDDSLEIRTHITSLSEDTVEANSRFFTSAVDVPKMAITMGLGTIMKAKKVILLASGKDKAQIISKIVHPTVDTDIPASILHLHNDVVVIADRDAASLMETVSSGFITVLNDTVRQLS